MIFEILAREPWPRCFYDQERMCGDRHVDNKQPGDPDPENPAWHVTLRMPILPAPRCNQHGASLGGARGKAR